MLIHSHGNAKWYSQWENSLAVSHTVNNPLSYDLAIPLMGIYS